MPACADLEAVRAQMLKTRPTRDPAWAAKMLHYVPDCPTVPDRAAYLVQRATGQIVLDLGCTGPISRQIEAAAKTYYGVDRAPGPWAQVVDLDRHPTRLERRADVTLIVASEFLEHLANPGRCLDVLAMLYPGTPLIVTVPNAGAYQVEDDCEVVNGDHVAWYSYTTLTTLLQRSGYTIDAMRWYHGHPHEAEGLIAEVHA